jgi:peptide/nickel transport system ATP-binding protein
VTTPLLQVRDLHVRYAQGRRLFGPARGVVHAVRGAAFDVHAGECVGLVGESGSGKSSLGRAVLGLEPAAAGQVLFQGQEIGAGGRVASRALRRQLQMVFQDPYASLNPRFTAERIVRAPLDMHGIGSPAERRQQALELMRLVGLRADQATHHPHQFSGGQRQRLGIARALAMRPSLVVCDEAVSALDVSVQAQILNLLRRLQADLGLAYLFISHDLGVVRQLCDRVLVMQHGLIVEAGTRQQVFQAPAHPYTRELLASVPVAHPRLRRDRQVAAATPLPLQDLPVA